MRNYLYRVHFYLLKTVLNTLPATRIDALGTWIAANPPAGDSAAQRKTFFAALYTETLPGGDAVTP